MVVLEGGRISSLFLLELVLEVVLVVYSAVVCSAVVVVVDSSHCYCYFVRLCYDKLMVSFQLMGKMIYLVLVALPGHYPVAGLPIRSIEVGLPLHWVEVGLPIHYLVEAQGRLPMWVVLVWISF